MDLHQRLLGRVHVSAFHRGADVNDRQVCRRFRFTGGVHVDERTQAVVLAEVAARVLVARRAVLDIAHRIEPDEGGLAAVAPQTQRLDARPNGARLPAVFVHDDLGRAVRRAETRTDEVHFRLHHRHIVLRSALQYEARSEVGQVRDARDVEEHVLREHRRETRQDLVGAPSLPLEVHNVGLHEHGAAVAEHRHGLRAECAVRELLDRDAEHLRRGLQEVSVSGRALRVELEILDPAVLQDNKFYVLAADVNDHVWIVVKPDRRFRVRYGLH
jgi:hypothetical protein